MGTLQAVRGRSEDTATLACFQVPGYGAKQITVTGSPSYVAISLEKDGRTVVHVSLPEGLDPAALNAVCTDGLLSIGYSKESLRQPTEMEVEVASSNPADSASATAPVVDTHA